MIKLAIQKWDRLMNDANNNAVWSSNSGRWIETDGRGSNMKPEISNIRKADLIDLGKMHINS